jgi:hypothetical protein
VGLEPLPCAVHCRALRLNPHGKASPLPCASPPARSAKYLQQDTRSGAGAQQAPFAVCVCTAKKAFAVRMCHCRVHMHGKDAETIPEFPCFPINPCICNSQILIIIQIHI